MSINCRGCHGVGIRSECPDCSHHNCDTERQMDIVERLRIADPISMQRLMGSAILSEAADEIERLQTAERYATNVAELAGKENVKLREENERLRAVLARAHVCPTCDLRVAPLDEQTGADAEETK